MRVYVVALLALLCAGCANQNVWVKDSITETQTQKDLAECRYDSEKSGRTPAEIQQGLQSVNPINKCMMLRGYYLVNKQDLEKK